MLTDSTSVRHTPIHAHFARLLPLFVSERAAGRPMVLATLVRSAGSTYRKPGAQMLLTRQGDYAGLLSGGCLESDLREHAAQITETLQASLIEYDLRNDDDPVFGLGAGCEGAMEILLQPVSAANHWQPMAQLARNWHAHRDETVRLMSVTSTPVPLGSVWLANGDIVTPSGERIHHATDDGWFTLPSVLSPRLLILGAGPDAEPLGAMAGLLGWKYSVFDHRPANLNPQRFAHAEALHHGRAEQLQQVVTLADYDAVIVMSHHLDSDISYLRQLAYSAIRYVGLLGPAARREKLFRDLGNDIGALRERLHAPVGLDIGAATPEAIALSIIAQVHQMLSKESSPDRAR